MPADMLGLPWMLTVLAWNVPAGAARRYKGTEDLLAVVRVAADLVERVDPVEFIGIRRVTAYVASVRCKRHFACLVRHNTEGRAVFFQQLKAVFFCKCLHKLIV